MIINNEKKPSTSMDYGTKPIVVNIDKASEQNRYYRKALWSGNYLQLTLMCIPVNGDIGLEMHPDFDQFIRIEDGQAVVMMGKSKENLSVYPKIDHDFAVVIPSGTWHNIINAGDTPLKLYSVYAPPHHPFGTVHKTKEDARQQEKNEECITSIM